VTFPARRPPGCESAPKRWVWRVRSASGESHASRRSSETTTTAPERIESRPAISVTSHGWRVGASHGLLSEPSTADRQGSRPRARSPRGRGRMPSVGDQHRDVLSTTPCLARSTGRAGKWRGTAAPPASARTGMCGRAITPGMDRKSATCNEAERRSDQALSSLATFWDKPESSSRRSRESVARNRQSTMDSRLRGNDERSEAGPRRHWIPAPA